jgi:serpin B
MLRASSATAAPQSFASGVNTFTFDLYRRLGGKPGNVFASPKNVLDCLAMVYAAARGETARVMEKVCFFPPGSTQTAEQIGLLNKALREQPDCILRTANGVWAQQDFPFSPKYVQALREAFGAEFRTVNYLDPRNLGPIARDANRWVEDQTRGQDGEGKIKDLLKPSDLSTATILTLISAIYFLGDWEQKFTEQHTQTQPFHLDGVGSADCRLMFRQGGYRYAETPELQAVELPYKGGQLSMTVLLPRRVDGLSAVEAALTGDAFDRLLQKMAPEDVHLFLPRWKVEEGYQLNDPLEEMGLGILFSGPDFGGMIEEGAAGQGPGLSVSKVIHKAFVEVNEKGTEAAAATAVVIGLSSALPPQEPRVFRADHPFAYAIRHVPTGTVLFVGRLSRPE